MDESMRGLAVVATVAAYHAVRQLQQDGRVKSSPLDICEYLFAIQSDEGIPRLSAVGFNYSSGKNEAVTGWGIRMLIAGGPDAAYQRLGEVDDGEAAAIETAIRARVDESLTSYTQSHWPENLSDTIQSTDEYLLFSVSVKTNDSESIRPEKIIAKTVKGWKPAADSSLLAILFADIATLDISA